MLSQNFRKQLSFVRYTKNGKELQTVVGIIKISFYSTMVETAKKSIKRRKGCG